MYKFILALPFVIILLGECARNHSAAAHNAPVIFSDLADSYDGRFGEPLKGPFTMHREPVCLDRETFAEIVMKVRWHLEDKVGGRVLFAVYRHWNGNVMWVEKSYDGSEFCITATGDPNYGA